MTTVRVTDAQRAIIETLATITGRVLLEPEFVGTMTIEVDGRSLNMFVVDGDHCLTTYIREILNNIGQGREHVEVYPENKEEKPEKLFVQKQGVC